MEFSLSEHCAVWLISGQSWLHMQKSAGMLMEPQASQGCLMAACRTHKEASGRAVESSTQPRAATWTAPLANTYAEAGQMGKRSMQGGRWMTRGARRRQGGA
ncbi:hypothetical protein HPP92_018646 [Vanilla planifolia]|nr:hypothetical protein HPP92_018646 [Vanilla planifolia]